MESWWIDSKLRTPRIASKHSQTVFGPSGAAWLCYKQLDSLCPVIPASKNPSAMLSSCLLKELKHFLFSRRDLKDFFNECGHFYGKADSCIEIRMEVPKTILDVWSISGDLPEALAFLRFTGQRLSQWNLLGQDNPGDDAEVRRQQCIYRYGSGGGLGRTTWVWRPRDDDGKHLIS